MTPFNMDTKSNDLMQRLSTRKSLGVRRQAQRDTALVSLLVVEKIQSAVALRLPAHSKSMPRRIRKPKIDRLTDADPKSDDRPEQLDRLQMMLRD